MRRTANRWFAVLLVIVVATLSLPATAHADSDDDAITQFHVQGTLHPDGSMDVAIDLDFDFGDDSGHGPYLTLPERMAIADDPTHWRSLPISNVTASSPTAPADVEIEREGGAVLIKVGDEGVDLTGMHHYRIGYRIDGVVNPRAPGSGLDELSWNPVGTGWEIPLSDVQVRLDLPEPAERTGCFTGPDYATPCDPEPQVSGSSVTYRPGRDLPPGDGMQVVAGLPGGSLPDAAPILITRHTPGMVLGTNPVSGGLGAAVLVAGSAIAIGRLRRSGDRQYAGVAVGEIPSDTGPRGRAPHRRAERSPAIHPTPQPPPGVTPGQLGVLADTVADQDDINATVVDLAVRGHLRIEEYGGRSGEGDADDEDTELGWKLVRTPSQGELRPYEQELLDGLFVDGPELDLATAGSVTAASQSCQDALYREVTDGLGWFRGNPNLVRSRWVLTGLGLLLAGIAATFALGFTLGLGFLGVGLAIVGILVMVLAHWAPGRTAFGTAVNARAQGFRQHLESTSADTIQASGTAPAPSAVDLFSQYLPYAMIWGMAKDWTQVFEELSSRGVPMTTPTWYVGNSVALFGGQSGRSFSDAITGLSEASTSAMTAATSSSGGGSGFSGGGGVGGGGGGGW